MPHDILRIVTTHVGEVNTPEYADSWATVAAWCLLAGQASTTGESFMSFTIEAITEVEDDYLGKWLEQRLNTTLGPRPQGGAPFSNTTRGGAVGAVPPVNFATDIGKGVALGLKALGGPLTSVQQGATKEGDEKTRYTDDDIAAIMGFSHVTHGDMVQPIRTTLNNAKQKNHDTFRRQLLTRMTEWGHDRRIQIDTGDFWTATLSRQSSSSSSIPARESPTSIQQQRVCRSCAAVRGPRERSSASRNARKP